MIEIKDKLILKPYEIGNDGLPLSGGEHYKIENCIIDLSNWDIEDIDESVGIIWGSSAEFHNCVIKGAGKLILCGCGDEDKMESEIGKRVEFHRCILEDFGRRGPEVQDKMEAYLDSCLIQNWGISSRFCVRSFAAWAHSGGKIYVDSCVFKQNNLKYGFINRILDFMNHIGQAYNDEGLKGVFRKKTFIGGRLWGLVSTGTGYVQATNCWKSNEKILIENSKNPMDNNEAKLLIAELEIMKKHLWEKLSAK